MSNKDFGALTAEIKAGTFEELLNATLNKTYFKNNSSAVGWQVIFDIPKIGSRIKFKNLIQTFPDVEEEFKVWTEKELYFLRLHSLKYVSENQYQYIFSQSKKSNIIDNIFSKEIFGEYKLNQESNIIITASDRKRDLLFDVIQIFSESFFCINCGNN